MKKRGNACECIQKFLSQFRWLKMAELAGLRYEDDTCLVECDGYLVRAYSYEVISGTRYRNGECVMSIW